MSPKAKWLKLTLIVFAIGCSVVGVLASLGPTSIQVETARAVRGPLLVTVDGSGRTRFLDKQTLSAPVAGELTRIVLRPGDAVRAGQTVAEILPIRSQPLDARSQAEISARIGAARAGFAEAQRNEQRAQVALQLAKNEAERSHQLLLSQSLPQRSYEIAEAEMKMRGAELNLARDAVQRSRLETQALLATLRDPSKFGTNLEYQILLPAPVTGVVLRVHNENAGPVQPGSPLLDIGDPTQMEIVVDLPTQSAVRVQHKAPVRIDGLGNGTYFSGTVKLVEPSAFTKVTALGVEEQRVNVIIVPEGDSSRWSRLGDGFAVEAHIEVQKATDVIKVPSGAVFRQDSDHAIFVIRTGRAHLTRVSIGNRSAEEVEVKNGLEVGALLVVHPSDKLTNNSKVIVE